MKKGITKDHIRYATALFAESNIKTTAFLIVGLPGETQETVDETIDFVMEMQFNNYLYYDEIGVAMIYPGAEVYTIAKARSLEIPGYGVPDDDYWLTSGEVPYYECENSYEQLLVWKEQIRDAISLNRINDPKIFLKQKKLLPSIIKYSFKFGMTEIINMVMQSIQDNNMFVSIVSDYFNATDDMRKSGLHKIARLVDIGLTKQFVSQMDTESQSAFMKMYEDNSVEEATVLKRWEEQSVEATDEYITPKNRDKTENLLNIVGQ